MAPIGAVRTVSHSIEERDRVRLRVRGAVQGVGFRPFVYRLAHALDLAGWVENSAQGVTIEVEGEERRIHEFERRLQAEAPPRAAIRGLDSEALAPLGTTRFEIRASERSGPRTALILPDGAVCPECLAEVWDRADRRHRYPFTNCTACGPRYSIILDLPYDRSRTTMARFTMCERCRSEYEDPADRRFHAEPNACPECGPRLELWNGAGRVLAARDDALQAAATAVREGWILAVKGLGGFHLLVDARDEEGVRRLRARKRREAKPLAVMVPSLAAARAECEMSAAEERLLLSPEAPIVLLRPRRRSVAPSVAPGTPSLGLFLPYTPLHHLLLAELAFPVVATSGNLSDEPICTDEREALDRLAGIADLFLVHDRPIARAVDDSVARVVGGRPMLLRRARGYAPFPVAVGSELPPILAVGAHLKNTVAVSVGREVFLSPHVGDLETEPAYAAFRETVDTLLRLYQVRPEAVACDAHPDYVSTQYARSNGSPVVPVQHHHAHVLAAMADHALAPPVLGFAWDGSGYGGDGTVWGGEALLVSERGFERLAWLRPFPLPGGEKAVREPRRAALGALYALEGDALFESGAWRSLGLFTAAETAVLRSMLARRLNSPLASSAGRLFDAVAALARLHSVAAFEGQAAMALEAALGDLEGDERYPFAIESDPAGRGLVLEWAPMLRGVRDDVAAGTETARISLRFHNTLAEMIAATAARCGAERVALTGGCFQNRYLTERAVDRLRGAGIDAYWHERVPPNDGGIAVGQVLAAARHLSNGGG
jgi:hydrogenase maturation protein HypF